MTDDPYDKMLDATAADYNRPGAVPREEMWAKIQAARVAAASPRSIASTKTRRIWVLPGVGIAALLILSAGILIGRRMGGVPAASSATSRVDRDPAVPVPQAPGVDTPVASTRDVASWAGSRSVGPVGSAPPDGGLPRTRSDAEADAIA